MRQVFLDTAFAIALSSPTDEFHQRALALSEWLEEEEVHIVTSQAVVLEIGDALARQRYRRQAVQLLLSLEEDPNVEIVPVSDSMYERAFQLFIERPDKEWGLTDCVSFVLMEDRGLSDALTTDEHFLQAGFRALLRED